MAWRTALFVCVACGKPEVALEAEWSSQSQSLWRLDSTVFDPLPDAGPERLGSSLAVCPDGTVVASAPGGNRYWVNGTPTALTGTQAERGLDISCGVQNSTRVVGLTIGGQPGQVEMIPPGSGAVTIPNSVGSSLAVAVAPSGIAYVGDPGSRAVYVATPSLSVAARGAPGFGKALLVTQVDADSTPDLVVASEVNVSWFRFLPDAGLELKWTTSPDSGVNNLSFGGSLAAWGVGATKYLAVTGGLQTNAAAIVLTVSDGGILNQFRSIGGTPLSADSGERVVALSDLDRNGTPELYVGEPHVRSVRAVDLGQQSPPAGTTFTMQGSVAFGASIAATADTLYVGDPEAAGRRGKYYVYRFSSLTPDAGGTVIDAGGAVADAGFFPDASLPVGIDAGVELDDAGTLDDDAGTFDDDAGTFDDDAGLGDGGPVEPNNAAREPPDRLVSQPSGGPVQFVADGCGCGGDGNLASWLVLGVGFGRWSVYRRRCDARPRKTLSPHDVAVS
jgi:hypothetical protein